MITKFVLKTKKIYILTPLVQQDASLKMSENVYLSLCKKKCPIYKIFILSNLIFIFFVYMPYFKTQDEIKDG